MDTLAIGRISKTVIVCTIDVVVALEIFTLATLAMAATVTGTTTLATVRRMIGAATVDRNLSLTRTVAARNRWLLLNRHLPHLLSSPICRTEWCNAVVSFDS